MIAPSNFRPGMTVREAVDGYIADGESREDAEALAAALVTRAPGGLPRI